MAEKSCVKRLQKEYRALYKSTSCLATVYMFKFHSNISMRFCYIVVLLTIDWNQFLMHVVTRPSPNDILESAVTMEILDFSSGRTFLSAILWRIAPGKENMAIQHKPECLKRLLLFACNALRDSEDEEAVFYFVEFNGRPCAVAPSGQVDSTIERARTLESRPGLHISYLFCS
ncbi:hypothetical protein M0R45_032269 [Rubus argutus]|uniref:Uncharacterized protein n=1 Tax=Rubus argutus TaxID=59490 RepID=A0AAW1WIZ9_RUBAR